MKKQKSTSCNLGFTLIELSIILVIIGLITGGIVGGKSLIESTKNQKLYSDALNISTAMRAYELKYDALPGDHIDAQSYFGVADCINGGGGTNPCNGNGDNMITIGHNFEDVRFFQHMSLAGTFKLGLKQVISGNGNGYLFASTLAPDAEFAPAYSTGSSKHYLRVAANNDVDGYYAKSIISPALTMKIDRKYDDGLANDGLIRASRTGGHHYGWTAAENCTSGSGYVTANTGPVCLLEFYMLD